MFMEFLSDIYAVVCAGGVEGCVAASSDCMGIILKVGIAE